MNKYCHQHKNRNVDFSDSIPTTQERSGMNCTCSRWTGYLKDYYSLKSVLKSE